MVWKAVAQEVLNSEQERCAASGHSAGQSPLKHPLITLEKLGLNDRREQKVQLGHVAKKCDCVFLSQLAFVGYLLTSCLAYCSVATQLTLRILLLNMEQLHLCISNSCGFAAPAIQQTETSWSWLLISTIISWWHTAFQNNLICSNSVNF